MLKAEPMLRIHHCNSRHDLYETLAQAWMEVIQAAPAGSKLSFALAGGSTPAPAYQRFATLLAADGSRAASHPIRLVATDERWVADSDPQSNEGLIAACMADANQCARHWELVSLKTYDATPAAAVPAITARLAEQFPAAFSALILGMGADGHIASLFPGMPGDLVVDPASNCLAALHPQSGQARISLSMARLLDAERVWLVIAGDEKRRVLECSQHDSGQSSPIGAFLREARCVVDVFWCADST